VQGFCTFENLFKLFFEHFFHKKKSLPNRINPFQDVLFARLLTILRRVQLSSTNVIMRRFVRLMTY